MSTRQKDILSYDFDKTLSRLFGFKHLVNLRRGSKGIFCRYGKGLRLEQKYLSDIIAMVQVEKAPVTIKTGLKKEEAEELKKKLEAG